MRVTPDRVVVAMANPLDEGALKKAADLSRREVAPVVATPAGIMAAIDNVYGMA